MRRMRNNNLEIRIVADKLNNHTRIKYIHGKYHGEKAQGVLPYVSHMGMCYHKGYSFCVILVWYTPTKNSEECPLIKGAKA